VQPDRVILGNGAAEPLSSATTTRLLGALDKSL
jgi:hypothetical protein